VSRIKIERYGYGKAIYVTHPNGYTTVYAHLDKFSDRIQEYVCNKQYEQETYEIQLFPGDLELRVDKGEQIAYSGNSGGSGGPHLHFEIRDSGSRPVNPFLFGIDIADTRPPLVKGLLLYPLDPTSRINGRHKVTRVRLIPTGNSTYRAADVKVSGRIGVAINTNDRQNTGPNQNGIYELTAKLNGREFYDLKFDRYSFNETRYLNNLIDYKRYKTDKSRYTKLFRAPSNVLTLFKRIDDNGVLNIDQVGADYMVDVRIADYKQNVSQIRLELECDSIYDPIYPEVDDNDVYVSSDQGYSGRHGRFSVYIPPAALYEDTSINISESQGVLHLHEDLVPLHKNLSITYDAGEQPKELLEKIYIARKTSWGALYHVNTTRQGNILKARTRTLGDYTIDRDTISPTILPINFTDKKWTSRQNTLELKITDDKSGIKSYRATVNGEFLLMEYDYKTGKLIHYFNDGKITDKENMIKVVVTDEVGNSSTFEAVTYRKPSIGD